MTLEVRHFGGKHPAAPLVCGTAAWNGLGFDPHQIWAFRRADLTAFAESPFHCENGTRATMAQIRTLPPKLFGAERLAAIAGRLLGSLLPQLSALGSGARLGVLLCLPERMGEGGARPFALQRKRLEAAVAEALRAASVDPVLRSLPRGHAALAFALIEAADALAARTLDACLVVGLDTRWDLLAVEELLAASRLFDGENLDSFIPGEGGALLLLGRKDVARALRWPILGRIEAAVTNREPATIENDIGNLALGLSRAARAVSDRLAEEKRSLDWWITDLTPETFRVQEFGLAWPRGAAGVSIERAVVDHPSIHLGDLGAASMPTAVTIALEGIRRGAPPARNCLVTGSSDNGDRGVVLVAGAPAD